MTYYFSCPSCGQNDEFHRVRRQADGMGCLILLLGGLLLSLLYLARVSREQVQCGSCGYIFRKPDLPVSPTSVWARSVSAIVLASLVTFVVLLQIPEWTYFLDSNPFAGTVARAVADVPGAALIAFVPAAVLILVVCLIGTLAANYRHRRELGEIYRIDLIERKDE